MKPEVSVIIPCYNQAAYLPEAVASVAAQTVESWECIIVNDGSTDETSAVASDLCTRDPRIRCIDQANSGVSRARNRALDSARGRFVQFLDADDLILPEKLELQLGRLSEASGPALSHCDYYYCPADDTTAELPHLYRSPAFNDAGRALQEMAFRWQTELSIPIHSFLFDSAFFSEHGIRFDESMENNEDWDCWMHILSLRPSVFYVDRRLAVYRCHTLARTQDFRVMRRGYIRAIRKWRAIYRRDPEMRDLLTRKIAVTRQVWINYAPWWERLIPDSLTACRVVGGRLLPTSAKGLIRKAVGLPSQGRLEKK